MEMPHPMVRCICKVVHIQLLDVQGIGRSIDWHMFSFQTCFGDKSNFTGKSRMATLAQKMMKTSFSMMQKVRKTTSRREFRYLARWLLLYCWFCISDFFCHHFSCQTGCVKTNTLDPPARWTDVNVHFRTEVVNTYDLGKCSGPYKCLWDAKYPAAFLTHF